MDAAGPVIRKLECAVALTADERAAVATLFRDVREFAARTDVIREGEKPQNGHAVLAGFACRYKLLPNGTRQIVGWLVPGDFCDLHVPILGEMDHGISTLAACRIAFVGHDDLEALTVGRPALTRALWWSTLVDESILREWIVGMGRRPADKQTAHLLCELLVRLRSVDLADDASFEFPVTQDELADTVGLSAVHVNRVLQQLRHDGLIAQRGRTLSVLKEAELRAFAEFNPNYLHR